MSPDGNGIPRLSVDIVDSGTRSFMEYRTTASKNYFDSSLVAALALFIQKMFNLS